VTPTTNVLVVSANGDEEWFTDAAAADAALAARLGTPLAELDRLRRRITVDPHVARRDGARWRSRQVWSVKSGSQSARVYEMLRVDEALYDH
jgi:hypothetical protein